MVPESEGRDHWPVIDKFTAYRARARRGEVDGAGSRETPGDPRVKSVRTRPAPEAKTATTTVSSRTFAHTVVIVVRGRIDDAGSELLRRALIGAMRRPPRRIIVDLGRVISLDPAAVGALIAAHDTARGMHVGLTVRNPTGGIAAELADEGLPATPRGR